MAKKKIKMKLFDLNWDAGGYGSGIMVVAARTQEEAEEYAKTQSKNWHFDGERKDLAYLGEEGDAVIVISECYQE